MRASFLPSPSLASTLHISFALLAGVLAWLSPLALSAQSVSFAGTQTTLPVTGIPFGTIGVAVDRAGDVFFNDGCGVAELPRTAMGYGPQITLPVSGVCVNSPIGVDPAGDVFFYDSDSLIVELPKTSPGYGALTVVTTPYLPGGLYGIAVDSVGDLFLSTENCCYTGLVSEFPRSRFFEANSYFIPDGIAVDSAGNLFVVDRIDPSLNDAAIVEFIAATGPYESPTTVSTTPADAEGIAVDSSDNLFITGPQGLVELPKTPTGYGPLNKLLVTSLGGSRPVAVDGAGDVIIGTSNGIAKIQPQSVDFGSVNVCGAGQASPAPCSQMLTLNYNVTAAGTLGTPKVLTLGAPGLDFTPVGGSTCTGSVIEGDSCTVNVTFAPRFAGARNGAVQIIDGSGNVLATTLIYGTGVGAQIGFVSAAQTTLPFTVADPYGVAVDGAGDVFVGGGASHDVLKFPAGGTATTVGTGLVQPYALALDGAGDLFVATNTQVVELPVGGGEVPVPSSAQQPLGVAVDGAGDVFIGDYASNKVLELPAAGGGAEITLPALSGLDGGPYGVALDAAGDVFAVAAVIPNVLIEGNGRLVELPAGGGAAITLSGDLDAPTSVAVDAAGNAFVTEPSESGPGADLVVEQPANGDPLTTLLTLTAQAQPSKAAVDSAGNVFVSVGNGTVIELPRSQPPSLNFASTSVGSTSSDSPQSVQIQNVGNATLSLSGLSVSANFDLVPGPGTPADCTEDSSLAPGASCNLSVSFAPTAAAPLAGTLTLTDNALNGAPATQVISLSGTGQGPAAQVSTELLQFGTRAFGSTSTLPVMITNTGGGTLSVAPSINGQSFVITGNTCGAGVTAGNSCVLQMEFSPVIVGAHDDILTLLTNGPANPTIKLKGVASGVGSAIRVLNFGTIPYHTSTVIPLTITNYDVPGTVTIGTAISGAAFQILTTTDNTCLAGIASGQSCTLPVEFSPTSQGNHNELLTLTPSSVAAASVVHLDGIEAAP